MSFRLHKQLRDALATLRKPEYTSAHIAVLETLAYRINDATGTCFPGMVRIADESFLSLRHTRKIMRQLQNDNVVTVAFRDRKTNLYGLNIPSPAPGAVQGDSEMAGEERALQTFQDPTKALEARLTYNFNQSLEPVSESSVLINLSPGGLSDTGTVVETGKPVKNGKCSAPAITPATRLHSILMEGLGKPTCTPSDRDQTLLCKAIDEYGAKRLMNLLSSTLLDKKSFWFKKLKGATWPCSMFCTSLPTMLKQAHDNDRLVQKMVKDRFPPKRKRKVSKERKSGPPATMLETEAPDLNDSDSSVYQDYDINAFTLTDGELDD